MKQGKNNQSLVLFFSLTMDILHCLSVLPGIRLMSAYVPFTRSYPTIFSEILGSVVLDQYSAWRSAEVQLTCNNARNFWTPLVKFLECCKVNVRLNVIMPLFTNIFVSLLKNILCLSINLQSLVLFWNCSGVTILESSQITIVFFP